MIDPLHVLNSVSNTPYLPRNATHDDADSSPLTNIDPGIMLFSIGMRLGDDHRYSIQFFDKWIRMMARVLKPLEPQKGKR